MDGSFNGLIHSNFAFCKSNHLLMPFDENIKGHLSCCESLNDLFNWVPLEDLQRLYEYSYRVLEYTAPMTIK